MNMLQKTKRLVLTAALLLMLAAVGGIAAEEDTTEISAGEEVKWQVLSSGGGAMTLSGYRINGTLGQTAVGVTVMAEHSIHQGFWQSFEEDCCGRYTGGYTGNTNCDTEGKRSLADITILIDHLYLSQDPLCCRANGNVNGSLDGEITLNDIMRLIDHIYISAEETAPCP
jgi:hypothetical protein